MKEQIVTAISCLAIIGVTLSLIAGDGASQKWVDMRIAQQETNTQEIVDVKIDRLLSTNGVSGAWVMDKIAQQETNTQLVVDQKLVVTSSNILQSVTSLLTTSYSTPTTTVYKCGNAVFTISK